jgi:hypothetical protein
MSFGDWCWRPAAFERVAAEEEFAAAPAGLKGLDAALGDVTAQRCDGPAAQAAKLLDGDVFAILPLGVHGILARRNKRRLLSL